MEKPIPEENEYVFIHSAEKDNNDKTVAVVYNTELKIGASIEYEPEALPYFMEWKSLGSGDYALGLEPATASVFGRKHHYDNGTLPTIASFEKKKFVLRIDIIDGDEEYNSVKTRIDRITSAL